MPRATLRFLLVLALTSLGLFSTGCGTDRSNVRFINVAVSSAPASVALDAAVDGKNVVTNLPYAGVSPAADYLSVAAGSRKVEMSTTGTTDDLINSTISFAAARHYSVFATGFVTLPVGASANFSIAAVLLTDDNSAPSSGNVRLRFLHAAPYDGGITPPGPPALDIYIVPPGTDITAVTPNIADLPYGQASQYQSSPASSNEIIVTPAGSKSPIIDQTYNTLAAGQVRTLVVVNVQDDVVPSPTPVVLTDLN